MRPLIILLFGLFRLVLDAQSDTVQQRDWREKANFQGSIDYFSYDHKIIGSLNPKNGVQQFEGFELTNCQFPKPVLLGGIINNSLEFKKDTFYKFVIIQNNKIYNELNFNDCIFHEFVRQSAITYVEASYQYDKFYKNVDIFNLDLSRSIMSNDTFYGSTAFYNDTLGDFLNFNENFFRGYTSFDKCYFKTANPLYGVVFTNKASFKEIAKSDLKELNFDGVVLPDTLDFSDNTNITLEIDLTKSKNSIRKGKPVMLYVYKMDCSKLILDYSRFKLLFVNPNDHRPLTRDNCASIYNSLLDNFRVRGQSESFELLDKEFQTFKHPSIAWLSGIWWDFGYKKYYILFWIPISILVFTILTFLQYNHLNEAVYPISGLTHASFSNMPRRGLSSFLYTVSIFFRITFKIENINFENIFGVMYLLLVYSYGLMCMGYLVNFIIPH